MFGFNPGYKKTLQDDIHEKKDEKKIYKRRCVLKKLAFNIRRIFGNKAWKLKFIGVVELWH